MIFWPKKSGLLSICILFILLPIFYFIKIEGFSFKMGRINKNVLKYGKKELNSSVSVILDLTEPKRNETKLPKSRNLPK